MVELMCVGVALLACPVGVVIAVVVGRWSPDLVARAAALVTGIGWFAAVGLAVAASIPLMFGVLGESGVLSSIFTIDGLAVVMLLLVLGLSAVIQLFAVRYLRGDTRQLWFVVFANLLTGATALMVCSGSVLSFCVAWIAAGISLMALLFTYPHLAQARDGVRRTAINIGIGDSILVIGLIAIVVVAGGDVRLSDVGSAVAGAPVWVGAVLAILLVVPAFARSSQVPFHGWLPSTLATPTPVSALMHAGVVNAGAILILRFSPLIGASTLAMSLIFCAGVVTVVFASMVRMVKPDVKGRLVFSTMAQMGFMFLACGLGAYSAAVFHLVSHGLFKSALFLGAGSGVGREAKQRLWPTRQIPHPVQAAAIILVAVIIPVAAIVTARTIFGLVLSPASQGLQLFVVFTAGIALGTALWTHFTAATAIVGAVVITAVAFGYSAIVTGFDTVLNLGTPVGAVDAVWLVVPGSALLALQILGAGIGRGATSWLYTAALAVGTPAGAASKQSLTIQRGSTP